MCVSRLLHLFVENVESNILPGLQIPHAPFSIWTHKLAENLMVLGLQFKQAIEILRYSSGAVALRNHGDAQC